MALYKIKGYVKLLCIRIDHLESYVIDEINASDDREAEDFINSTEIEKTKNSYF